MTPTNARRPLAGALLALGLVVAGCDSPSEPPRPVMGEVEAYQWDGSQVATAGEAVGLAPAVRVLDTRGRPMVGVSVAFLVTRGGGQVTHALPFTNSSGIASAGTWRLGAAGVNEVEARAGTLAPVRFSATATPVEPPAPPTEPTPAPTAGAYHIDVRVVGSMTARQRQAVETAVARWEDVMTRDAPDVAMNTPAGACFARQPALNALVDDLVLYVDFVTIDGPGSILGEAGPCYIRSESGLPIVGYLKLDSADLARMERAGTLDDVVLHEIGHVLGIGTMWEHKRLVEGDSTDDPRFVGANAVAAYRSLGGLMAGIEVENTGGEGTRGGHWRETVFGNELMTGYIGTVPNPLSAMTIASLLDLGYGATTLKASQYTLGSTFGRIASEPVELRGREQVKKPKFKVDRHGRKEKLRE